MLHWNYQFTFYIGASCNQVRGSDGAGWPPNVGRDDRLYLFHKALCRSLPLTHVQDVQQYGMEGYRFAPPKDIFDDTPDNQCYCVEGSKCLGGGVFNASKCLKGSPAVISWPHFFQASQKYLDAVEGLQPVQEKQPANYRSVLFRN